MPSEAIEVVRRGYEAYEADGVEGMIKFLDPEIEWRNPSDSPIAGVFHGHEGVREWFRLADEAFAEIQFRPEELIEAPDGRVLAICAARIRGRGSEIVLDIPFAHVIELRDGNVVAFQMFPRIADARAAVGLSAAWLTGASTGSGSAGYDRRMEARSDEFMLEIERALPAPSPVVFAAFSDPNELVRWWGPAGFTTPSLRFEARVGERYRIEMRPPEGDPFYLTGEFREVDAPARLAYTFVWEDPDPDDAETLVTLSFRDLGGSTDVAFTQGPFRTEARCALHRDGWTDGFDKLERLISAQA